MEVGDGQYLRLQVAGRRGVVEHLDTGWLALERDRAAHGGYVPTVLVSVELGALAEAVRGD